MIERVIVSSTLSIPVSAELTMCFGTIPRHLRHRPVDVNHVFNIPSAFIVSYNYSISDNRMLPLEASPRLDSSRQFGRIPIRWEIETPGEFPDGISVRPHYVRPRSP